MNLDKKQLIQNLISSSDSVTILTDGSAIENKYLGDYADISQQKEQTIIKEMENKPWKKVVEDHFYTAHNWLYRIIMDPGRTQFLDILNYKENGKYLDVGSGWGQVSIPLARKGEMVSLDLTKNRLDILGNIAKQEGVDLHRIQGNFLTFPFRSDLFDLIIFNGSLEWIGSGREEETTIRSKQLEALCKAEKLLSDEGLIYIGIENSMGAKYLMGTKDDHTGIKHIMYLSEQTANQKNKSEKQQILAAKTWSLSEYYELFEEANLEVVKTYACFPDYKLIRQMIDIKNVNEFILSKDWAVEEYDGSNGKSISLNKELKELYKILAANHILQYFCPSYAFVLKRKVV